MPTQFERRLLKSLLVTRKRPRRLRLLNSMLTWYLTASGLWLILSGLWWVLAE